MAGQAKRRDKGISEYDTQLKEIRAQLTEQLKCLDTHVELRCQCLQDLGEFFRRKAEIELDYSRSLDKLTERFTSKLRTGKDHQGVRKDPNALSPVNCWHLILSQCRQESRDHGALSEIYSNNITLRLSHINEDVARLSKKSKEIGVQMQEELLKVTGELQTAMKTYHTYHMESVNAEGKLQEVERLEEKHLGKSAEHAAGQVGTESKAQRRSSLRKIEKLKEKRQERYLENQLKCTKARNEYLLNLSVANAALNSYFIHNVSTLIDCWDLGFHSALGRALRMYLSAETHVEDSRRLGLKRIESAVSALDPESDKSHVMASNNSAFCLPAKFEFLPHDGDEVCEVRAVEAVYQDLQIRIHGLQGTLATANLETDEINKTLKATVQTLQSLAASEDTDLPDSFQMSLSTESVRTVSSESSTRDRITRRRTKLQETEIYYFTKLKEQVAVNNRITKLQAKFQLLKPSIEKGIVEDNERSRLQSTLGRSQRQRRSRPCSQYVQKLFGGDLELFIKTSGQSIPLVVVSCIRFLNLYGLHHEGIFRIPGSQSEVNDIKGAFERGEDPLDTMNEHNLDSVAGVLKLYFRGLSKPIFPVESFSCLTACVETEDLLERAHKIKAVVTSLESSIVIVMRYLFAFLHHLSQYSDENMMDPHNLAVCFGPTLVTVPPDQDPVSSQARVNEAIKTVIVHHDKIFPGSEELPGPVYEKCMTQEEDYCDSLHSEAVIEECEQDVLLEIHGSEDDSPGVTELRATVRFDYAARSVSELSLRKGESLRLFERVSNDWWRGETGQGKGLVPHKYIQLADTVDGGSEPLAQSGSELGSSEEKPDSSRVASLSDSESEPIPRKRSGSSPIRRRFPDGAVRIPVFQPSAPRPLPSRSPALEERLGLPAGFQERRNTLDLYQLTHSPKPVRTAPGSAGKLDRQHSERPIAELNKDMVKNMDLVFRELLQNRRHKSSSEEVHDPRKGETPGSQGSEQRRSSGGALDRPPLKQGPPPKQGKKARATALFKPSGGGIADTTP